MGLGHETVVHGRNPPWRTTSARGLGRISSPRTEPASGVRADPHLADVARAGHGCFFHDLHEDAITKIKFYLADAGLRDRVIEVNLASRAGRQPGWNLFVLHGRSPDRAAKQVDAVVDAFASTLQWDERNTRALNLVTQSAQALTELAAKLPPELAPTRFRSPRRGDVLALCALDQELQDASEVRIDVCLLSDLQDRGPLAPIFRSPDASATPTDWLGATDPS